MIIINSHYDNLQETVESLIQDVIFLEAMELRLEQHGPHLSSVGPEVLYDTRRRALDYLAQHTTDLFHLTKA